jgi:hypothetical protein
VKFRTERAESGIAVETVGLAGRFGHELRAVVDEGWAVEDAQALIELAAGELAEKPATSTTWWSQAGFRRLRWHASGGVYLATERFADQFRPSVQRASADWGAQHWVCNRYDAAFDPISEESLVAVSARVWDGDVAVEGTRYEMAGANSGWIIIDEAFRGGVPDLTVEHAAHLADARPDLVRYFGLPIGWRFFSAGDGESVRGLEPPRDDEAGGGHVPPAR